MDYKLEKQREYSRNWKLRNLERYRHDQRERMRTFRETHREEYNEKARLRYAMKKISNQNE